MSGLKSSAKIVAPLCFLVVLNACSFSYSSESSSDIASSPSSISSSGSSQKYESDVVDYTYAYLKSSSTPTDYASFQKGLADIAEKRGISDWESDPHTYQGIGKALKKANISGVGYDTFKQNFANGNPDNMKAIQDGYDSN